MSQQDDERWRCVYVGDRNERCHYPGSLSHETRGGARFYCRFHFHCASPAEGAQAVIQSRDWMHGEPLPIRVNPDADEGGDSPVVRAIRATLIERT